MEADQCDCRHQRLAAELDRAEDAVADDHDQRGVEHRQNLERFGSSLVFDTQRRKDPQQQRHQPVMERRMVVLPDGAHIKVGQLEPVIVPVLDVVRVTPCVVPKADVVLTVGRAGVQHIDKADRDTKQHHQRDDRRVAEQKVHADE